MKEREIFLFGVPRILANHCEIRLARRRSVALLAYLGVQQRRYGRESVATLLWPDADRGSGLASLRQSLTDIRHALGADVLLESGDSLELNSEMRLDVDQFERELETASVASLTKAIERSGSAFMDGFYLSNCEEFESWQGEERGYLRAKRELAFERIVSLLGDKGSVHEARHYLALLERESPDPDRVEDLAGKLEAIERTRALGGSATGTIRASVRVRSDRLRDRIVFVAAMVLATAGLLVTWAGPAGFAIRPAASTDPVAASLTVRTVRASQVSGHAVLARSLERQLTDEIAESPSLSMATEAQSSRFIVELSIEADPPASRCRVDLLHPATGQHLWRRIYPLSDVPIETFDDDSQLARAVALDLAGRITTALVQYLSRSGTVPPDPTINPPI